jgi:hypothetical protein
MNQRSHFCSLLTGDDIFADEWGILFFRILRELRESFYKVYRLLTLRLKLQAKVNVDLAIQGRNYWLKALLQKWSELPPRFQYWVSKSAIFGV